MAALPSTNNSLLVLVLDGVYRQQCAKKLVRLLKKREGVISVSIHLPTRAAFIEYRPKSVSKSEIHQTIREAGYGVLAQTDRHSTDPELALLAVQRELARYRTRTVAAIALWGAFVFTDSFDFSDYTLWLMATALVFWAGAHFHKGALRALKTFSPDLNLLASLSALLIYAQGTLTLATRSLSLDQPHQPYWLQLAALIALTNLGRLLEKQALASQARA
ncbi:MAG TPA: cation transporter, partial [Elusimicrobiales bacterium]|nr:cation transporter [Elusimicrobiales bacterium]